MSEIAVRDFSEAAPARKRGLRKLTLGPFIHATAGLLDASLDATLNGIADKSSVAGNAPSARANSSSSSGKEHRDEKATSRGSGAGTGLAEASAKQLRPTAHTPLLDNVVYQEIAAFPWSAEADAAQQSHDDDTLDLSTPATGPRAASRSASILQQQATVVHTVPDANLIAASVMAWREREARTTQKIDPHYFRTVQIARLVPPSSRPAKATKQPQKPRHCTPAMRAMLVDWIIDVADTNRMPTQTAGLAVRYIDRSLSRVTVDRGELQLLGITALWIASKIEDIYPPTLQQITEMTANTYTHDQVRTAVAAVQRCAATGFHVCLSHPRPPSLAGD